MNFSWCVTFRPQKSYYTTHFTHGGIFYKAAHVFTLYQKNARSHDALPCTARSVLNGYAHRYENGGATSTTYRATPKRRLLYGRPSRISRRLVGCARRGRLVLLLAPPFVAAEWLVYVATLVSAWESPWPLCDRKMPAGEEVGWLGSEVSSGASSSAACRPQLHSPIRSPLVTHLALVAWAAGPLIASPLVW
ncbi:hypothetical protein J6590_098437 [Homalodisca vitripennis]|nr:hypothetical protein J6590_098437 [Homalodisca vitripennis]